MTPNESPLQPKTLLDRIIAYCLDNKLVVIVLTLVLIGWGIWSEVLPALGILEDVSLWTETVTIDGEVEERYALAPRQHAALILPMVESLLASAELVVTQLDALALGQGMGAFTGVRMAAGGAKGMAFAANNAAVQVLTLAAARDEPAWLLILDCLQDPQNLGTLLRTAEVAGAIEQVLVDDPLRRRMIDAGRRRTERLTWQAAVERTVEVYRAALGGV